MDALMNWKMITSPTLQKLKPAMQPSGFFKQAKIFPETNEDVLFLSETHRRHGKQISIPILKILKFLKMVGGRVSGDCKIKLK